MNKPELTHSDKKLDPLVSSTTSNSFIFPKRYEMDPDKIQTLEDVKQILIGIDFNVTGEKYFEERPNLKQYFKEKENG